MEKCLVTKLNGVVNNDSLMKLGEFTISLDSNDASQVLLQLNGVKYKCSVATTAGDANVDANTEYKATGWSDIKSSKTGKMVFTIIDKYNAKYIHSNLNCNIKGATYLTNCTQFTIPSNLGDLISLADFSNSPYLTSLRLGGNITGDLASLNKCTAITSLRLGGNITGDLAIVSPKAYSVSIITPNTLIWSYRENSNTLFSLTGNPKVSNIDKMLQDLSNCTVVSTDNLKQITATGTRTSASDAAVQTLQSKGYTVSVTPA